MLREPLRAAAHHAPGRGNVHGARAAAAQRSCSSAPTPATASRPWSPTWRSCSATPARRRRSSRPTCAAPRSARCSELDARAGPRRRARRAARDREALQGVGAVPAAGAAPTSAPAGGPVATVVARAGHGLRVGAGRRRDRRQPVARCSRARRWTSIAAARSRDDFDYVLIDAPPPLEVSDVMPLLRLVDGIVIVARVGQTRESSARAARRSCSRARRARRCSASSPTAPRRRTSRSTGSRPTADGAGAAGSSAMSTAHIADPRSLGGTHPAVLSRRVHDLLLVRSRGADPARARVGDHGRQPEPEPAAGLRAASSASRW